MPTVKKSKTVSARQRKSKKRCGPRQSVEDALFDRIIVGLIMRTADEFDGVPAYVLNPGLEGAAVLELDGTRTRPAFITFHPTCEALLRRDAGFEGDLVPFWIGRFIAFTENDVVFGWTMLKDSVLRMRIIGFDYSLVGDVHGEDFAAYADRVPADLRIARALLSDVLQGVLSALNRSTGFNIHFENMQGIDPGLGAHAFSSKGGDA